jgi:uncharacterized protein
MKYLFFLVHPAKVNQFRVTINELRGRGHTVDVIITGRAVLEDLVVEEGWPYTKIFPKGRKIPHLHIYLSAGINMIRTIFKLLALTKGKKYDLFVTDDLLTIVGRMRRIPSIFVTDDDLKAVPESFILAASAHSILAPAICDMGRYEHKKIGYQGYKSLAHLHPNHFKPDRRTLHESVRQADRFFFLRLVSPTSTHDVGKSGISDGVLSRVVALLKTKGRVVIDSERPLPDGFKDCTVPFRKKDAAHYLAFADIFISDSTTMCAEAAVLGTPSLEVDDWYGDFRQYRELNERYGLVQGFRSTDCDGLLQKIEELLSTSRGQRDEFQRRRSRLLDEKMDVSSLFIRILAGFPEGIGQFKAAGDTVTGSTAPTERL